MNLFILAWRNIKRNFDKYKMYFFSLSFSVFTAYSFLALMHNEYVKMAFTYDDRYQSLLTGFGIVIMVFVLFFLLSSNNSFIKARKKEISTYSLLGMTNAKIGQLLFMETMIVGFAALVIGIGAGIFFSKLIAMILLDISLASFTGELAFTIDPHSIYITAIIFTAVFGVMGLSGLRVISKFELVDLFKAEKVAEGRSKGSLIVLLISLALVGTGYYLASSPEPAVVVPASIPVLVLVILGTYLFFWEGLAVILNFIKKKKGRYYKAANLISISAFSHRMRTIGAVMATIAVLSAVATTGIATGYTLYSNTEKNTYEVIGYDMYFYGGQDELLGDIEKAFDTHNTRIIQEFTTQRYTCKPQMETFIVKGAERISSETDYFRVYSQSVYNKLVTISRTNNKPVDIKSGQALYIYPFMTDDIAQEINGQELAFSDRKITVTSILRANFVSFGAIHTIVINDNDFDALIKRGDIKDSDNGGTPYDEVTVFTYDNPLRSAELNHDLSIILSGKTGNFRTAYSNFDESLQVFGLICFIGFFMSAVFILMTASLLYFKQVMAAEEERHQYKMLRKIGMDDLLEKRVISSRLLPVFFIPLAVGIIHSIFAMKAADTIVFSNMISVGNSYVTVLGCSTVMYGLYALVYGVFYFITREQYSRIVK